jgi:tRNA(adenine34) deaminase
MILMEKLNCTAQFMEGRAAEKMMDFYKEALLEAEMAYDENEVPVGCVVVKDGEIIGRGRNHMEGRSDPSGHAEVMAIREAAEKLGTWRLTGCTLYVTLEPCLMCSALIRKSRIGKVYIGTIEPREGAFGSALSINDLPPRDHHVEAFWLYDPDSEALLRNFFKELRRND